VHRKLSERFKTTDQVKSGVKLENGGQLHVCVNPNIQFDSKGNMQLLHESARAALVRTIFSDLTLTDNRILASAAYLADTRSQHTILVTKDINMMLKARTLGIEAQDYRTDRVEDSDIRRTQRRSGQEDYESLDIPATRCRHSRARSASRSRMAGRFCQINTCC
jgi:PhoH-like ATPase